jgi:hypothetical protein
MHYVAMLILRHRAYFTRVSGGDDYSAELILGNGVSEENTSLDKCQDFEQKHPRLRSVGVSTRDFDPFRCISTFSKPEFDSRRDLLFLKLPQRPREAVDGFRSRESGQGRTKLMASGRWLSATGTVGMLGGGR